jgi:hypothetical protein
MPESLAELEQQRATMLQQISELEDFRPGSITGTGVGAVMQVATATVRMIQDTVCIPD